MKGRKRIYAKLLRIKGMKIMIVILLLYYIWSIIMYHGSSSRNFSDIQKDVLKEVNFENMSEGEADDFKHYYGLNYSDYENVCFYYPSQSMGVDELLLVKTKDQNAMDMVASAVEKRLETQKERFDGYGAEQMELLSGAIMKIQGDILFFAVSSSSEKIEQAFVNAL